MAYTSSGWTYIKENEGYVDLLDNSGEITYSSSGICGGVPSSCETTAEFLYNIGLVDWTMSGDDPCNIVKSVDRIPSCNQEMLVCWFNDGGSSGNTSYSDILTDYGAEIFVRKNVDECNHVMIISGDPSTQDYSNYQFVHGNKTQYFSTSGYTDSGYPVIATDPDNGDFSPKYSSGTTYAGHKIKYLPNTDTISGTCIVNNPNLVELYFPDYGNDKDYSGCTIKNISNGAFSGNTNLSAITLNAVETIGNYAFSECTSLVNIDWGRKCCNDKSSKVSSIGNFAFYGCTYIGILCLDQLSEVRTIGIDAFAGCNHLETLRLPTASTYTKIEQSCFEGCDELGLVNIPSNIKEIESRAFYGLGQNRYPSNYPKVIIPNSVKTIGDSAFGGHLSHGINVYVSWGWSSDTQHHVTLLDSSGNAVSLATNCFGGESTNLYVPSESDKNEYELYISDKGMQGITVYVGTP